MRIGCARILNSIRTCFRSNQHDTTSNDVESANINISTINSMSQEVSDFNIMSLSLDLIKKSVTKKIILHMIIELGFSSLLFPWLMTKSNAHIIADNINYGIVLYCGFILLEIINRIHSTYFLDYNKVCMENTIGTELENVINNRINGLDWDIIKQLEKDNLVRIKDTARWSLSGFIQMGVQNVIFMFPFIGYTVLLLIISPMSILLYACGIFVTVYFFNQDPRDNTARSEMWTRYNFLDRSRFRNVIHHKYEATQIEMNKCMAKINEIRSENRFEISKHSTYGEQIFDIIFMFNLYFLVNNNEFSPTTIIMYLQYTLLIKQKMFIFSTIFKQYAQVKKDFDDLSKIVKDNEKYVRKSVKQIDDFSSIEIKKLVHVYKQFDKPNPFSLKLVKPIILTRGEIIRLDGDSGKGKSTFADILCSVIPYKRLEQHEIYYDNKINIYGFDAITTYRGYLQQFEDNYWKNSIFEIVSELEFESENEKKLVWESLQMAECDDFLNLDSISVKGINPSGGQQGRICIARLLYQLLKNNYKMIVLDEVDKSIQAEMAVRIMKNIFAYCKKQNILCVITAHSTEVKNMIYDQTIKFNDGFIN